MLSFLEIRLRKLSKTTTAISTIAKARTRIRIAQSFINNNKRSPELIELIQKALKAEYQQWDLYYAYKDELKGLSRDNIADHFSQHAAEEAEHINVLQRYLVSMGVQPTKQREEIPQINALDPKEIIELQLKFEQAAILTYQQVLGAISDTDPLRIEIENILAKEEEHRQELELYLTSKQALAQKQASSIKAKIEFPMVKATKQRSRKVKTSIRKSLLKNSSRMDKILDKGIKSSRRLVFLQAIGYCGDKNHNQFKFKTKTQVKSAIKNLLDRRSFALVSILSGLTKNASLEENIENRHRKYSKEFQQWYKDTSAYWKQLIEETQEIEGVDINFFADELVKVFKNQEQYDELMLLGIKTIDDNFNLLINMLKNNISNKDFPLAAKKVLKEMSETRNKLENTDDFMRRLFTNILYELGK